MSTPKQNRTRTVSRKKPLSRPEGEAPVNSGDGETRLTEDERRRMVAEAAYYRAQRRGFAAGGEVEDWLAAEREINALLASPGSVSSPRKRVSTPASARSETVGARPGVQ